MKQKLFYLLLTALVCLPAAAKWKAKHVVLIGLDGWGAYSVPKATNIPNIQKLMQGGCYTLKKRSVLPSESADARLYQLELTRARNSINGDE